jgi:lysophospholipase L1-like esterase
MLRRDIRIGTLLLALGLVLAALPGCSESDDPFTPVPAPDPDLTILALGDSYTVGHSLPAAWSWPYQLADTLAAAGDSLETLEVIAQTGWTTRDLLDATRDSLASGELDQDAYGLVTLMIGVNNQFQGLEKAVFEAEMDTLIALAVELADGDPSRVLGFSIPDYGVTPVGGMFDPARIAVEIDAYNVILQRKYGDSGILMLDVTTLSRLADTEPQLVARDGLHYSREMYARWVSLMLPEVESVLTNPPNH